MSNSRLKYIEKHGQYKMKHIFTPEIKEKMRRAQLGKKHTDEHKAKIGLKASKPVLQIKEKTNEIIKIWISLKEVAKEFKISPHTIKRWCLGTKSYKNHIWKLKN